MVELNIYFSIYREKFLSNFGLTVIAETNNQTCNSEQIINFIFLFYHFFKLIINLGLVSIIDHLDLM